jgi:two-component system cell cycle sensor histidine kinase/response regulator CckA
MPLPPSHPSRAPHDQTIRSRDQVRTLAGFVAHDFNNVLTAILGNVELVRELLGQNPSQGEIDLSRSCLDAVEEVAHRAAGMTQQLLAFSRCQDAGGDAVDLHEAIRQGVTAEVPTANAEVTVVLDLHADPMPPVRGTSTQLAEVVGCLIRNAVEAMPNGGTIRVGTRPVQVEDPGSTAFPDAHGGEFVLLTVVDQGTGIPPEIRDRVFLPFFTTKTQGKSSGLGLAIVAGVVAHVGGFVRIADGDPGAVLEVFLPPHTP